MDNRKDGIHIVPWHHIQLSDSLGKGKRVKFITDRFTPNVSNEEEAARTMKGSSNYQICARRIRDSARLGNNRNVLPIFAMLEDDDDVKDIICTCRGNLEVIYLTLLNKPWVFKHIDIKSLEMVLKSQAKPKYNDSFSSDDDEKV